MPRITIDGVDYIPERLFETLANLLKHLSKDCYVNVSKCNHFKRLKVYFNLMKSAVDKDDMECFQKIAEKMWENESAVMLCKFLYPFLKVVDETTAIQNLFDRKDTMSDDDYLYHSNRLKEVHNFKKAMKEMDIELSVPCCS